MSTGGVSEFNGTPAAASSTQQYVGKLGYALGISIAILLLITTATLLYYFCVRAAANALHPGRSRRQEDDDISIQWGLNDAAGLDDAALKSCPKVTYVEAKHRDPRVAGSGCSVCLADYGDDDEVLRLLPECGHLFHEKCVDPWLRLRPTSPVCRSSPAPSPMSTPLAEVVPLASRLVV